MRGAYATYYESHSVNSFFSLLFDTFGITFDELEDEALNVLQIKAIYKLISDVYPLVIVDEFQDVNEKLLNIITALGQESRLVLLRGPGQCIYRNLYNFDPDDILEKCKKTLNPVEFVLKDNDKKPQRFCPEIKEFMLQFEEDKIKSSETFPVKFSSIPLRNRNNNPNHLDIFAALELREMRNFFKNNCDQGTNIRYAILASTNSAVAKIYRRITNGSQTYSLYAHPASLLFGDNILLSYGRFLLYLLKAHWIAKINEKVDEKGLANLLTLFFLEQDKATVRDSSQWLPLTNELVGKVRNMKKPNTPSEYQSRLINNIGTINDCLRATRQNLPNNSPSTPFDKTDIPLLELLASDFIKSVKPFISITGKLDFKKATPAFEKLNQQKVVFEKQGLQKNIQVMTIHKAKGREFDGVILVLEDSRKAVWQRNDISDDEIEDLYRVAISRAKSAFSLVAFNNSYSKATSPVKKLLPTELFQNQGVKNCQTRGNLQKK